jgi:hypothetical protein
VDIERVGVARRVGVGTGDRDTERVAVRPLRDRDGVGAVSVAVEEPEKVRPLFDTDRVTVAIRVPDRERVPPLRDTDWVIVGADSVTDSVRVPETETVGPLPEPVNVNVMVGDLVGGSVRVTVDVAVAVGVLERVANRVTVVVAERVRVGVGVFDRVPVGGVVNVCETLVPVRVPVTMTRVSDSVVVSNSK